MEEPQMAEAKEGAEGKSVLIFEHFRDGMRAEDILMGSGFRTSSGSPPPQVRTGCDLAISVPSADTAAAEKVLKEHGISVMDVIFKFEGGMR